MAAAPRGKPAVAAAPTPMAIRPAPTPLRVVAAVAVVVLPIGLQLTLLTLDEHEAVVEAAETAAASAMRVDDEERSIEGELIVFLMFFVFFCLSHLFLSERVTFSIENQKTKNRSKKRHLVLDT